MIQIDPKSQRAWDVEQEILECEVTDAKTFVLRGEKVHLFKREEMWADLDYTSFEQWAKAQDISISGAKLAEQYWDIFHERFGFERGMLEGQSITVGKKEFFKPVGAKNATALCPLAERLWRTVVGGYELSRNDEYVTQLGMTFDLSYRRPTGTLLEQRQTWIDTHRRDQFAQAKRVAREMLVNGALMTNSELREFYSKNSEGNGGNQNGNQNTGSGGVTFQRVYEGVTFPENLRQFETVKELMQYYDLDKVPDGERLRLEIFWIREPGAVEHEAYLAEHERSEDDDDLQFEDF